MLTGWGSKEKTSNEAVRLADRQAKGGSSTLHFREESLAVKRLFGRLGVSDAAKTTFSDVLNLTRHALACLEDCPKSLQQQSARLAVFEKP